MIRYNHLIVNCLIFYDVFEISRILKELRQEGFPLDSETTAELSPYWTQHINSFGLYALALNHCPLLIDYDAPIVQNPDSLNAPTQSL